MLVRKSGSAIADVKRSKQRLHSLDTFRGFALTVMIFVNYGGEFEFLSSFPTCFKVADTGFLTIPIGMD